MEWKIEVGYKSNATDSYGEGIKNDIKDLGILDVQDVKTMQIYILLGDVDESDVENICKNLLTDSITQYYEYKNSEHHRNDIDAWVVDVTYKPGVTDAVGESTVKGIKDLGISGIKSVKTGKRFIIKGDINEDDITTICRRLLANEVIQNYSYYKIKGEKE